MVDFFWVCGILVCVCVCIFCLVLPTICFSFFGGVIAWQQWTALKSCGASRRFIHQLDQSNNKIDTEINTHNNKHLTRINKLLYIYTLITYN